METVLGTLLTTLTANALLARTVGPDTVVQTWEDAGMPVPFVLHDALGGEPEGLLLWVARARRAGVAALRFVPVHPTLPYTVPKVDPADHRAIAGARAVAVAHLAGAGSFGPARAVVLLGPEADVRVVDCARVAFAPLGVTSPGEAVRALRETVMSGLSLVEGQGPDVDIPSAVSQAAWRDWQADMSKPGLRDELAPYVADPRYAGPLHAALEIHELMSPILAPQTVGPPEVGALLGRLHRAAADVLSTATLPSGR